MADDDPLKIDLDPEDALRALLKIDPEAPPAPLNENEPAVEADDPEPPQGDPLSGRETSAADDCQVRLLAPASQARG